MAAAGRAGLRCTAMCTGSKLEVDQMCLISTFRLPVQIHTRSANAKWLNEIAHTNPLWLHPRDAGRVGVETGDLVRVETEIGHFVVKAWVTEGIHPGVVACSHHMGRWKTGDGPRQSDGYGGTQPRRERLGDRAEAGHGPVRLPRPRHRADLVDGCGGASEHDLPSPARPGIGRPLLGIRWCGCGGRRPTTATGTSRSTRQGRVGRSGGG